MISRLPLPSRATAAIAATLALAAFGANMASPLYPGYQAAFGFDDLTLTVVYATYAVVSVPALLVLGPAGDRFGWRPLLRCGLLLSAVGSLCFLLATGPGWLLAGRVATGLALGAVTGSGMAALVAGVPPARRARHSTLGAVAFVAGTAAGPGVTGVLAAWIPSAPRLAFALHVAALAAVWCALPAGPGPRAVTTAPAPLWTRPQVPRHGRRVFAAAAATGAVSWTVVGLYLGLMPSVIARVAGTGDPAVLGGVVATVLAAALPAQLAVPRLGARPAQRSGLALLAGSLAVVAVTGAAAGVATLALAAVLAGLGHGLAYGGAHEAVRAAAGARSAHAAGLTAAAYVVFFLGSGLPAVAVGLLGRHTTLATAVAVLAWITLAAAAGAGWATARPGADPRRLAVVETAGGTTGGTTGGDVSTASHVADHTRAA